MVCDDLSAHCRPSSDVGGTHRVDFIIPSDRAILRMMAGRGACSLVSALNHGEGPSVQLPENYLW